jgi:integrase
MDQLADGTHRISVRFGTKQRQRFRITTKNEAEAAERAREMIALGAEIGRKKADPDVGYRVIEAAGEGRIADARGMLAAHLKVSRTIKAGDAEIRTMDQLAAAWTSNAIARQYPDNVRPKKTAAWDIYRYEYLAPTIGHIPVKRFVLADAEAAMRTLPAGLARRTRRGYAQIMCRMLQLAVYPLKLIPATPIPRGFLPKVLRKKASAWLYPSEERKLMACEAIPVAYRVLYGYLAREGMRLTEGTTLQWRDLNLDVGVVTLDRNKTDDPRAWAMAPGVTEALKRFKRANDGPEDYPFLHLHSDGLASTLRKHMKLAGIDRAELFDESEARSRMRVHDLRATMITIALANGKSETWVSDRTGHKSSEMINTYKRASRTAAELKLGELAPLDEAIAWPTEAEAEQQAEAIAAAARPIRERYRVGVKRFKKRRGGKLGAAKPATKAKPAKGKAKPARRAEPQAAE